MTSRTQVLQNMLAETDTHPKIKQTIKIICMTREKVNFHAHISASETYLQIRGLSAHNYDEFNYINKMLYSSMTGVLGKIKRKEIDVRDREKQFKQLQLKKYKQENEPSEEIVAEVEHVLNNLDLPISLFKRNDNYWYHDNPRTVQAKEFIHSQNAKDRQRKQKMRAQRKKRQMQKQKIHQKVMQKQKQEEQRQKQQKIDNAKKKIQQLKENEKQRQKNIEQSQKFYLALKPMFKKIENQYNLQNSSALEEQKKRFSEIRKLRKSVDITQIEEHKKKLDKLNEEHEKKKIFNDPLKVSFKSKYHTSMTSRSRIADDDTIHSLYQKKMEYGKVVKSEHKPQVNEKLVREMEERLKLMNRRRVKKNKKKGEEEERDEDDSDSDEEKEKSSKAKDPLNEDDEDQEDEDYQPKRVRGQDEDPDRGQRYEMGLQYLDYVRNLRKKPKEEVEKMKKELNELIEEDDKRERQKKQKIRYTNYLKQYQTHKTIDHLDTSRISYHKSILGTQFNTKIDLDNETRKVEMRTKQEQMLLRHKKVKQSEAINKKMEIDNAVVDTIKARLALMN